MMIDTEVFDQEVFAEFAPKIVEAVQEHGGRFLMRGGTTEVIEGGWTPHRIVVMEFDASSGRRRSSVRLSTRRSTTCAPGACTRA